MQSIRNLLRIVPVTAALALGACEGASTDADWGTMEAAITEGTAEAAGVLRAANTLDFATLDVDVGLDARAARAIVDTRTANGNFATIAALDAVSYVGEAALERMRVYAEGQGWIAAEPPPPASEPAGELVNGVAEGSVDARRILAVANTIDRATLDDDAGLDARAATNIFNARPHADLAELDAVPYVSAKVFEKLLAFAIAKGIGGEPVEPVEPEEPEEPAGPPYQETPVIHGIQEGTYEAFGILRAANEATLIQLDDEMGLDTRAAKGIFHTRAAQGNYRTLADLDAVTYVGAGVFQDLLEWARARNLLPTCGDRTVQPVMEQCDGTLGCDNACRITFHCGDGATEVGEECDDGNDRNNDGCNTGCRIEWLTSNEQDRRVTGARDIGSYQFLRGTIFGEGDTDYFRFTLNRPTIVRFDVWSGAGNNCEWFYFRSPAGVSHSDIFGPETTLRDANDRPIVAFDTNCGRKRTSQDGRWDIERQMQPGTYYLRLEGQDVGGGWDSDYRVGFQIEVQMEANGPICGNGQVEAPEACDDGNPASNDGCSQRCEVEMMAEVEPNGDAATAKFLATYRYGTGSIAQAGDEDWWSVRVGAGQGLTAEVASGGGGDCGFDARLEVYDAAGTQIAWDDDDGPGYCPRLDPARDPSVRALPEGIYRLRVRHADARVAGGAYRIEALAR